MWLTCSLLPPFCLQYGTTVVALQDANPELKDTTKLQ